MTEITRCISQIQFNGQDQKLCGVWEVSSLDLEWLCPCSWELWHLVGLCHIQTCSTQVPFHFHQHQTPFDRNHPKAYHFLWSDDQDGLGKIGILLRITIAGLFESVHHARTKWQFSDHCSRSMENQSSHPGGSPAPVCAIDFAFRQNIINPAVLTCFQAVGS